MVLRGTTKRFKNVFTDFDGTPYDPTTMTLIFRDPLGVTVDTFDKDDCTKEATGTWHIDYETDLDAMIGRWTLEWQSTIGLLRSTDRFAFFLFSTSEPTILEVQTYLNNITEEDAPLESIDLQIYLAMRVVDTTKSSEASEQDRFDAVLAVASHQVYFGYASKTERGTGTLPLAIREQLERYRTQAEEALARVRRAKVTETAAPIEMTTSLYEEEEEEEV